MRSQRVCLVFVCVLGRSRNEPSQKSIDPTVPTEGGDESVLINCRSGKNYWIVRTSRRPTDRRTGESRSGGKTRARRGVTSARTWSTAAFERRRRRTGADSEGGEGVGGLNPLELVFYTIEHYTCSLALHPVIPEASVA